MAELVRTDRWEGEVTHTRRDGRQVIVASRWSLQRDERGRPLGIMETNTDITERKRADTELRESERRYRNIFETAGVSIWEEDFSRVKTAIDELKAGGVGDLARYIAESPDFVRQTLSLVRIIDVNEATLQLLGARSKEEIALPEVFLPDTEQAFAAALVALAEGRTAFRSETVLRTVQGEILAVLFTITFPPGVAALDSVLISIMDITERNRAQDALHRAQDELAHVTRLTTLGELTASIAHEVNQPLAAVVTNGQACLRWLARAVPDLDEARGAVRRIIGDADRASEVIRRIRDLARKSDPHRTRLGLNEVIEEASLLVRREVLSERIALRLELMPSLPAVLGDRIQLQQVIINLLVNGIQAMAPVTERPRLLLVRSRIDEADQVLVEVEDTGNGIEPENLSKVFETFFTTKPDGMGMGLSICRSIIEAHGGCAWASRNAGPGTTFHLTLPALRESAS